MSIIDDAYSKDIYSTNLLVNEVKNLDVNFAEKATQMIIEKRENIETVKKIIEHYLTYVVEQNFDAISEFYYKYK